MPSPRGQVVDVPQAVWRNFGKRGKVTTQRGAIATAIDLAKTIWAVAESIQEPPIVFWHRPGISERWTWRQEDIVWMFRCLLEGGVFEIDVLRPGPHAQWEEVRVDLAGALKEMTVPHLLSQFKARAHGVKFAASRTRSSRTYRQRLRIPIKV